MKYILLLALWLFPEFAAIAQTQATAIPDSRTPRTRLRYSRYLETGVNYPFVDTLSLWRYSLDTAYKGLERDKVKALGKLYFWRSTPVRSQTRESKNYTWTPCISFEIYLATDSSWCLHQTDRLGLLSSCWVPNTDRNIVRIGKYLLVSRSPCVECQLYDSPEYCHPVIAAVVRQAMEHPFTTIQEMAAALPLQSAVRLERGQFD